ncbi:MAG TPA: MarC family protein [Stellaceae bacterium]|jgi:multiple antibiotic resistance protein
MLRQFIFNCVALVVIVDPVGTAAIFAGLTRNGSDAHRRRMALRGTLIATGLILSFAFGGEFLLLALGVELPAFQVAGGVLLFFLATEMVFARHSGLRQTTDDETAEAERSEDISVFPLAIPLLAGPGALTSIVLLMRQAGGAPSAKALVVLALVLVMLGTFAVLLTAGPLLRLLGVTGTNVVSRVLGVILAALAAQLLLTGVRQALFG